jgi:hypothetical protein
MGQVNSTTITSGSIVNGDVSLGAGIQASKLGHQHLMVADWGYADTDGTIATEEQTIFIATSACTVREVKVWCVDSGTNTDIDFDLQVGDPAGASSTILTGDITILNGTGDQTAVLGTFASASMTAGQHLVAVIKTVTQNTGATGPRMQVTLDAAYV